MHALLEKETQKNYYPTPKRLINKMVSKIKNHNAIEYILEPSAGKGNIIEGLTDEYKYSSEYKYSRQKNIHAIEKDPVLVAVLRENEIKVIDYDFLQFSGVDKYDLIIANPPFDDGEKHLLKAIDIMYAGEIVFLLNAETIKNPYSSTRKELVKKLNELNAEIEYIEGAFQMEGTERKTSVEVALIHILIEKKIEDDLFKGTTQSTPDFDNAEAHKQREIVSKENLKEMVASYDRTIETGTKVLLDFYSNYHHIGQYMSIESRADERISKYISDEETLTRKMKTSLNEFIVTVRKSYWQNTLNLDCVSSRMTSGKQKQFYYQLQDNENMNFTESNVLAFICNVLNTYEDTLAQSVAYIFDEMTKTYAWDESLHNENVHYFNGWKTNQAFKVNKKVVLPFYQGAFTDSFSQKWGVSYRVKDKLNDIDKIMNYFDSKQEYLSILNALEIAFNKDQSREIESTYFTIHVYKKGTIHLKFKQPDILRRFNVTACKHKNWIPFDYGQKKYNDLNKESQDVAQSFEGEKEYNKNVNPAKNLFMLKNLKMLPFFEGK